MRRSETTKRLIDAGAMLGLAVLTFNIGEAFAQADTPASTPPLPVPALPLPEATVLPVTPLPTLRVSIFDMVREADPVVQAVMAFLLLCSVITWAALLEKTFTVSRVRNHTRRFAAAFRKASTMDGVQAAIGSVGDGPATRMWAAAKKEWDVSLSQTDVTEVHDRIGRLLQRMVLVMGCVQEQSLSRLGSWMGLLATIGSTAPFIGLFGTVWGILNSFAQIAATKNTTLSVVAPGIAEALLATAVGLFAAIPATMIYNRFARAIGQVTGQLDNVTAEMIALASRDIERLDSKGRRR